SRLGRLALVGNIFYASGQFSNRSRHNREQRSTRLRPMGPSQRKAEGPSAAESYERTHIIARRSITGLRRRRQDALLACRRGERNPPVHPEAEQLVGLLPGVLP